VKNFININRVNFSFKRDSLELIRSIYCSKETHKDKSLASFENKAVGSDSFISIIQKL
jgi:hypothetical protein